MLYQFSIEENSRNNPLPPSTSSKDKAFNSKFNRLSNFPSKIARIQTRVEHQQRDIPFFDQLTLAITTFLSRAFFFFFFFFFFDHIVQHTSKEITHVAWYPYSLTNLSSYSFNNRVWVDNRRGLMQSISLC